MEKMVILVMMELKVKRDTPVHLVIQDPPVPLEKLVMAQLDLRYVCMYVDKGILESGKSLFRVVLAGQATPEHVVMLDQRVRMELKDTQDPRDLK